MFEAQYVFSPSVARRAFVSALWHEHSSFVCAVVTALGVAVVGMRWSAVRLPCVFVAGFACFPCFVAAVVFLRVGPNAKEQTGTVELRFTEEILECSAPWGHSSVPWSAQSASYLTRGFVVFVRSNKKQLFVPRKALGVEALAFVRERLDIARLLSDVSPPEFVAHPATSPLSGKPHSRLYPQTPPGRPHRGSGRRPPHLSP